MPWWAKAGRAVLGSILLVLRNKEEASRRALALLRVTGKAGNRFVAFGRTVRDPVVAPARLARVCPETLLLV